MSRAIRIHKTGGPEVLQLDDVDPGKPGPGQALVRHTAIGVNFIDTYHRSGLYPLPSLPHGIGGEAAGVVEAVGTGVTLVKPGDRVAYAGVVPGSYAEARLLAADRLVPLPDGIDERTAAAMLLKGMTVEYLIRRTFKVEAGMTVLFHAAAGGVGSIACQWLKHLGATVIGTVGSDAKAQLARAHGCDHPINYTRENVVEKVRALTGGRGVPVVYDGVGRSTFEISLDCLARRGMLVGFGNASGAAAPVDPLLLSRKGSLYLTRPTLMDYTITREELLASAAALFDVVRKGAVKIAIGRTWPLAEAAAAHRALQARETTGCSLLLP
ncbi:MAG TPA: quinone oxidoreductase [Patescibacteria group bacterium]|nr:quinone oxidoreductase [Patescibacteria group bacterium]